MLTGKVYIITPDGKAARLLMHRIRGEPGLLVASGEFGICIFDRSTYNSCSPDDRALRLQKHAHQQLDKEPIATRSFQQNVAAYETN
nr:hypothetical protein CFP56_12052 [Quercus suber]